MDESAAGPLLEGVIMRGAPDMSKPTPANLDIDGLQRQLDIAKVEGRAEVTLTVEELAGAIYWLWSLHRQKDEWFSKYSATMGERLRRPFRRSRVWLLYRPGLGSAIVLHGWRRGLKVWFDG
jgi:hypothetical protein